MDQNVEINLDREFKKYLEILRPYLGRLIEQNEIEICNAWIKKLSYCNDDEKSLRNKYVFALCYQLAKGTLDEPFLSLPPSDDLPPINDIISRDSSFAEIEYLVIDSENGNIKTNCDKETPSQIFTDDSGINVDKKKQRLLDVSSDLHNLSSNESLNRTKCKETLQNYNLPYIFNDFTNCTKCDENYQFRVNNLIMKLREIKNQNILLRNELVILRQEANSDIDDTFEGRNFKVDSATSTHNYITENNTSLKSLKLKLQEIQNSRNDLIKEVSTLQDKLDYFNDIKKHEIEEIEARHKLEMIKLKTLIREEVKTDNESKFDELKKQYEKCVLETQENTKREIEKSCKDKEQIIEEKDRLLQMKEAEISILKRQLEELKSHQLSVIHRFLNGSVEKRNGDEKSYDLEKRLYKMERTKNKCVKVYEAKIASLQREKHLAECSLQLQLVKQRAQVLNIVTEENQVELATALEKLENKYKEIVANVQATAVQRRVQDQIALGSLIQAVCGGVVKENPYANPTNVNANQFSGTSIKNQCKENHQTCDKEFGTLCGGNRVDNVIIENKSFVDDSVGSGYCLESEKLCELFERVHIPQRDVGDVPK